MKPSVYIETTIPSLLTSRTSRDLQVAAQQEATQHWWDNRRFSFDLYASEEVVLEVSRGNPELSTLRCMVLDECILLPAVTQAEQLAKKILAQGIIPEKCSSDAIHIALAVVHEIDFLLTWNCRHIHNAMNERRLEAICRECGYVLPVLCTPLELMIEVS